MGATYLQAKSSLLIVLTVILFLSKWSTLAIFWGANNWCRFIWIQQNQINFDLWLCANMATCGVRFSWPLGMPKAWSDPYLEWRLWSLLIVLTVILFLSTLSTLAIFLGCKQLVPFHLVYSSKSDWFWLTIRSVTHFSCEPKDWQISSMCLGRETYFVWLDLHFDQGGHFQTKTKQNKLIS